MKNIILLILAVQVILIAGKPQSPADVAAPGADAVEDSGEAKGNATETKEEVKPLLATPLQCLYDSNNIRVNHDCHVELPPKCAKGTLVSTKLGDEFEMCCCNFSKYVHE